MSLSAMRNVRLPSGDLMPVLGLGTWHYAEDARRRKDEIAALQTGLDLGMNLIDTAEMYAEGEAEKLVGQAIRGRRDEVFLVSKVLPMNATRRGTVAACERSLRHLGTDRLDLYLLHWRGEVPLEETLEGFEVLRSAGKIRQWGVSNFDVSDLEELVALAGGEAVQTDQVLYNLVRRGIENDLMPWCMRRGMPIMAYSPIEQGILLEHPELRRVAARLGAKPAQVALAWVLMHERLSCVVRAGTPAHVREDRVAMELRFSQEDLDILDAAFPPPTENVPLEMH